MTGKQRLLGLRSGRRFESAHLHNLLLGAKGLQVSDLCLNLSKAAAGGLRVVELAGLDLVRTTSNFEVAGLNVAVCFPKLHVLLCDLVQILRHDR